MKHLILLPVMAAALASSAALAGSDSGFYIGASAGSADLDYSDNDPILGNIDFNDDDSAYKIFGGFNLGLVPLVNLAVEAAYVDFGSQTGTVAYVTGNKVEVNAWTAALLAGFDLGPVGLFAKAGFANWDGDVSGPFGKGSVDGTDPLYGVGAKLQFGSLAVRAEYEWYDLDNLNIDYVSVGGSYTF